MQSQQTLFTKLYDFQEFGSVSKGIPAVAAGVYAVWQDDTLIYCGMSGREVEKAAGKARYGLITRLEAHWNGRLSGDQFCVYVANRLVIPTLERDQLDWFASGALTLDQLTRDFIRKHLKMQHRVVDSSNAARDLERRARSGKVFGRRPLLNPLEI